ncbi:hypothetical protein ACP4OV_029266 [Aristida adscensionis]
MDGGAGEAAAAAPPPPPPLPFLVHDAGDEYLHPHALYSIASRAMVDTTMDLLLDHRCLETPQGCVLALRRASPPSTFLWCPQDGRRFALPEMAATDLPRECKCLLTHKLSDEACVVVVLDLARAQYWFCRVREGTKWQHRRYTFPMLDAEGRRRKWNMARGVGIAAVGGKIYYELSGHELGVLEFDPIDAKPTLTRMEVDIDMVCIPQGFPIWLRYFVESCGELFLVVLYFRSNYRRKVSRVAIYKMDFSASIWCQVDHIGNRVFLLCRDQSDLSRFGASCSSSDHGLTTDRIYFFNNIFYLQQTMHVFDLTNKTEEVTVPFNFPISPKHP